MVPKTWTTKRSILGIIWKSLRLRKILLKFQTFFCRARHILCTHMKFPDSARIKQALISETNKVGMFYGARQWHLCTIKALGKRTIVNACHIELRTHDVCQKCPQSTREATSDAQSLNDGLIFHKGGSRLFAGKTGNEGEAAMGLGLKLPSNRHGMRGIECGEH